MRPTLMALLIAAVALLAGLNLAQYTANSSEEATIERFAELFMERHAAWYRNQWWGIQTLQNPLDAWITQEIIQEVKPDFIVEAGTYQGGSAPLWATILEQVNPEGRVITIDIEDQVSAAERLPIWKRKVDFLVGSSTDPAIVAEVRRRVQGHRVLVILDSLHTRDHVLAELRAYAPMVNVGSYVIVQDTGLWRPVRDHPEGWASDAVEAFLAEDRRFAVDPTRERFILTNCPRGFLRRIR